MVLSGGPEAVEAYRRKLVGGDNNNPVYQAEQRRQAAEAQGLKPDSPGYQSFVLTGRMPREDQQPLSATDKKAIMEADEGVLAAENALASLDRALKLSPNAMEGIGASTLGKVTSQFGHQRGLDTVELDNEVKSNALSQMKAIFGANPTEGERQVLLEIQGSSSMPHDTRKKVFEKAKILAQRRLEFNKQRAAQMRGGEYYKPNSGAASPNATINRGTTSGGLSWSMD
jgi:hypothetical protein